VLRNAKRALQPNGAGEQRRPTAGVENAERGVDELFPESGVPGASEPAGALAHAKRNYVLGPPAEKRSRTGVDKE
jgi:hypothetical protein